MSSISSVNAVDLFTPNASEVAMSTDKQETAIKLMNTNGKESVVYLCTIMGDSKRIDVVNGVGFIEPGKSVTVVVCLSPIAQYNPDEMDMYKLVVKTLDTPSHVKTKDDILSLFIGNKYIPHTVNVRILIPPPSLFVLETGIGESTPTFYQMLTGWMAIVRLIMSVVTTSSDIDDDIDALDSNQQLVLPVMRELVRVSRTADHEESLALLTDTDRTSYSSLATRLRTEVATEEKYEEPIDDYLPHSDEVVAKTYFDISAAFSKIKNVNSLKGKMVLGRAFHCMSKREPDWADVVHGEATACIPGEGQVPDAGRLKALIECNTKYVYVIRAYPPLRPSCCRSHATVPSLYDDE